MGPAEDDQLNLQVEPEPLKECVIVAWTHHYQNTHGVFDV